MSGAGNAAGRAAEAISKNPKAASAAAVTGAAASPPGQEVVQTASESAASAGQTAVANGVSLLSGQVLGAIFVLLVVILLYAVVADN